MAHVTALDAQRAQDLLADWFTGMGGDPEAVQLSPRLLELRGMLAGLLSDVREAAYVEGIQRGRKQAAVVIRDALDGEGL